MSGNNRKAIGSVQEPSPDRRDQGESGDHPSESRQLRAELVLLKRDLAGSDAEPPILDPKVAEWLGRLLTHYLEEKEQLEARIRRFEHEHSQLVAELLDIIGQLAGAPDSVRTGQSALARECADAITLCCPVRRFAYQPQPLQRQLENMLDALEARPAESLEQDASVTKRRRGEEAGEQRYSISLLGGFRIATSAGKLITPPGGKTGQLLKYLIVHRRTRVSRELLMELFWPRHDPESARNNLNVAVYGLRKVMKEQGIPCSCVVFRDGGYQMDPDTPIALDTDRFNEQATLALELISAGKHDAAFTACKKASELYGGVFLPDDLCEEWTQPLRQDYSDRYANVCRYLADYLVEARAMRDALDVLAKLIEIDDCDESVHRRIMMVYALMGQRHLALRQFNLCRQTLARELNVSPDPETMDLFERIRRGEIKPA